MPVEIEEGSHTDDIHVTLICEGCGEIIDEHEAFADRKEEYEDMRPIHDKVSCKNEAQEEADSQ